MSANISHGRGGAANIGPDETTYADGGIVREGVEGDQGDGAYSSGRGGQGNIGGATAPASGAPHDAEIVPETATRLTMEESHHVGRGGAGNTVHTHEKEKEGTTVNQYGFEKKVPHDSIGGKIKDKLNNLLHKKN